MALFLITACAEDSSETSAMATDVENSQGSSQQSTNVMNQPVDFSSAEAVEKSLQNIREKEGDKAYKKLNGAMQYLMVYDLSVKNNKEKLYAQLDGMTPEQIIAKVKR
jgi:hypothetical protein